MNRIPLQPLRIPAGWVVNINIFFEEEPTEEFIHYFDASFPLIAAYSNITQLSFDLEYAEDKDKGTPFGYFCLYMMKKADNSSEYEDLGTKRTKSLKEAVELIENFMLYGN